MLITDTVRMTEAMRFLAACTREVALSRAETTSCPSSTVTSAFT